VGKRGRLVGWLILPLGSDKRDRRRQGGGRRKVDGRKVDEAGGRGGEEGGSY